MPKKILSLDGGGTWALLQAMALKAIYKDTSVGTKCKRILNEFDVVAANSGGSLVLAAMMKLAQDDGDIDQVFDLFMDDAMRRQLFSPLRMLETRPSEWVSKLLRVGPKYKSSRKIDGIRAVLGSFGDLPMHELESMVKPKVVICGFDYDMNRAVFFKTHQSFHERQSNIYSLANAVHAATNAPVRYFNAPVAFDYKHDQSRRFWDGAVGGNNNPVLPGITELLIHEPNIARTSDDILVLSIGTGNNLIPVRGLTASDKAEHACLLAERKRQRFSSDLAKIATSITSEPPEASTFMAHMLLGGHYAASAESKQQPCVVRMNPLLQPILKEGTWSFPALPSKDARGDFIELIRLEMDAVRAIDAQRIQRLGQWWIEDRVPNQAILYNAMTFECRLGHAQFSAAKRSWHQRCQLQPRPVVDAE